jgi:branched-chain amino acid transport system permease protein
LFSPYVQSVLAVAFTYTLVTLGLQVTLSSGQFSVCHAALMGIGGYASGVMAVTHGLAFVPDLLVGALAGGVAGLVVALVVQRTTGILLATVTIALGQGASLVAQNSSYLGGANGYTGIPLTTGAMSAGLCALAGLVLVLAFRRTRPGLAMLAVGKDETVARSLGMSVLASRMWGFGLGGALAGTGGALLGHINGLIQPSDLSFSNEPLFFIFLMVGGLTTPWGAVAGTIAMWWAQELLRFGSTGRFLFLVQADRYWIIGLVLVAVVLTRPLGLLVRRPLSSTGLLAYGRLDQLRHRADRRPAGGAGIPGDVGGAGAC